MTVKEEEQPLTPSEADPDDGLAVDSTSIGSLCISCGLCCDGTLFDEVPLSPSEGASALWSGLYDEDREAMSPPCTWHDGHLCTVYEDRPAACRSFECLLILRIRRGEVSWDEAREAITAMKSLAAQLSPKLGRLSDGHGIFRRVQDTAGALITSPMTNDNVELMLDLAEFRLRRASFVARRMPT